MNVGELIEAAARSAGTAKALAARMGKRPSRLSEWKSGNQKPDAGEIAFLADVAGLPIMETVAEIEKEIRPQYADIWLKAISLAGVPKSLFYAKLSSSRRGPKTGRFGPHRGWVGLFA